MLKRLIRILMHGIALPLFLCLIVFAVIGIVVETVVILIEYVIKGESSLGRSRIERWAVVSCAWLAVKIDNLSYWFYCKLTKTEYEKDYWL